MPITIPKSTEGKSYLIPNKPYNFQPEKEITVPGYYDEFTEQWVEEYTYTQPRIYTELEIDGQENGGRTWARILTPIIGIASVNPQVPSNSYPAYPENAIGHGYDSSRTYSDQCYGLLRGLNGGKPTFLSNFNFYWNYAGAWTYVYEEYGSGYWWDGGDGYIYEGYPPDYYTTGRLFGGFFSYANFPSAIHGFVQDELEYMLDGASVITAGGTVSITNDLLTQYYLTSDASAVTVAYPAPYGDYQPAPPAIHILGMTGVNT